MTDAREEVTNSSRWWAPFGPATVSTSAFGASQQVEGMGAYVSGRRLLHVIGADAWIQRGQTGRHQGTWELRGARRRQIGTGGST